MRSWLKGVGVVLLAGCGSKLPATNTQQSSAVIGAEGGTATSPDGIVSVTIPPGALSSDVSVTIETSTSPAAPSISEVYEIGPTGTQFATAAKISFQYGSISLGGADPATLRVATFASGAWQILSDAVVDANARIASATTMHLSPYALVAPSAAPTCATVYGGLNCGSVIITGGSSGAGGSVGAAQTSTPGCEPASCAGSGDVCAPYPGATVTACSDGPGGYTATCCFPAGGQACLATMQFEGCSIPLPDGGVSTTCPNPPRCATDMFACSQYSGATLQDCTDNPN